MALPKVFHQIRPQDFTLTPITVHKQYVIQKSVNLYSGSTPVTESGYKLWAARYIGEKLKLSSSTYYPTNSWDGSNQHIIWSSIDSQYYRYPYDRYATKEHSNPRLTFKYLNTSASIISVPEMDFGERILPGSVEITASSFFNLSDDGNGNLYVNGFNPNYTASKDLVSYWSFRDLYRYSKQESNYYASDALNFKYYSKVFEPGYSFGKNLRFIPRTDVGSGYPIGFSSQFSGNSFIRTDNRNEINFTSNEDFSISLWAYFVDTVGTSSLITKKGTVNSQTYGTQKNIDSDGNSKNIKFISSSYIDVSTNVYPYDIELYGSDTIRFTMNNGISKSTVDIFPDNDSWNHIVFVKSGSMIFGYHNGGLISSASQNLGNCSNDHCLMFGSKNQSLQNSFVGSLDEIRLYRAVLNDNDIITLRNSSDFTFSSTNIIGNVFYRSGKIVIGGLDTVYADQLINPANDFTLKFKGTHTIYQYETLVRVPMGSFNLSQNPSARQNPYTDLIINDMTGSLDDGALFPYATQVGLYNGSGELLAVAKLSQPIQMRDDVDMNLLIRWDV